MKTFLKLVLILHNLQLCLADWEHPHYSFRCLENEGFEFFGVHNVSSIDVLGKPCNALRGKSNDAYYFIPYTCMNKTVDGHNATIEVYDSEFDSDHIPAPTPKFQKTPAPSIYQGGLGLHKFVVTCHNIPDEGIKKTVAHVFQEKIYNKLPDNYKEVGAIEMRFKAIYNPTASDISSVYIGDEFYMFIKYMGEQNYTVIPEECTAFGETSISKGREKSGNNFVELWNIDKYRERNNTNDCVEHKELLEGFGSLNETLIYAKMYGFRFAKKDYVTITCQVKIYNIISVGNKTNLCMDIPGNPVSGRRKRNIENVPFQTQALTKRLRVFDNKDVYLAENNGQRIKWETSRWMMIFATATLHTWLANS